MRWKVWVHCSRGGKGGVTNIVIIGMRHGGYAGGCWVFCDEDGGDVIVSRKEAGRKQGALSLSYGACMVVHVTYNGARSEWRGTEKRGRGGGCSEQVAQLFPLF